MVRVALPQHLRTLAKCGMEVEVDVPPPVTNRTVFDALEKKFPVLGGTIRDYGTKQRRAFLRFFACGLDLSNEPIDAPLPEAVAAGTEVYYVIGALAGG